MASQADVRRIALSLPATEEAPNHFAFSVRNKGDKLLPSGEQVAVLQSGTRCRLSRSGRDRLAKVVGRAI